MSFSLLKKDLSIKCLLSNIFSQMSWAVNEWKDGLSHKALQEITKLESQVDRLQKERVQKQFQMDGLDQVIINLGSIQKTL